VGSLTKLLAGGDTVPVSLQERVRILLGVEVREGYGMTEERLTEGLQAPDYAWEIGGIDVPGIAGELPYLIGRPIL
jgi:acyl-CoA synthetase (AMP-forming)/AMP-acid ligase II